jgi:[ribosomal protein S18]-alanine N-acetyltransferase
MRPLAKPRAMAELRRLNRGELAAMVAVERSAQPLPWTDAQLAEELDHPNAIVWGCVEDDQQLVAYAACRRMVDEWWLLNLATAPDHRCRGHGDALVAAWCARARADRLSVWLEVRASNANAQRLYARHGLVEVARRRGYYRPVTAGPHEDAIIMSKAAPT